MHRRLDVRLALAAPRASGFVIAAFMRLPARSRARRWFVNRCMRASFELLNANDFDAMLGLAFEPDFELRIIGQSPMFNDASYQGHDGARQLNTEFHEAFDSVAYELEELIDRGDAMLARVAVRTVGVSSGVETLSMQGWIYRVSRRGKLWRQENYWSYAEAEAAFESK